MKLIQNVRWITIMLSLGIPFLAYAKETTVEKTKTKLNDVKRELNKAGHRIQEETCMEGDMTCAGRKVKNRAVELKDATIDGTKEIKNKID